MALVLILRRDRLSSSWSGAIAVEGEGSKVKAAVGAKHKEWLSYRRLYAAVAPGLRHRPFIAVAVYVAGHGDVADPRPAVRVAGARWHAAAPALPTSR